MGHNYVARAVQCSLEAQWEGHIREVTPHKLIAWKIFVSHCL